MELCEKRKFAEAPSRVGSLSALSASRRILRHSSAGSTAGSELVHV